VAALAAYKDLSAPWKELLTWYNQTQDMGLRWRIITERFAPDGMVEEELMADGSAEAPRLDGPIRLEGVGVRDGDGGQLLEGLDVEIPTGSTVAITSQSATERRAIAELLARELTPSTGRITIGGQPLACLHQDVIARRIGLAGSRPYLFSGSIGRNISMALEAPPATDGVDQTLRDRLEESRRAGNSADPADLEWLRPERAGAQDSDEVASWWLALTEVMGTDEYLFERGLDARFDPAEHPQLAEQLVALRPEIDRRIREKGLCKAVHRFDPETFNDGLPVAGNLLFATPSREISQVDLANNERFQTSLETLGLCEDLFELGRKVLGTLIRVFGDKGSEHPLFRGLGIDVELYARLTAIEARSRGGHDKLDNAERRLLLTVPFRFSAEQIGETFPASLKEKILRLRETRMAEMRDMVGGVFVALDETRVASGLTVMENALFGKPVLGGRAKAAKLRKLVSAVLLEAGAKHLVAELIYDVPTAIGGSNLPQVAHERIAFVRAAIKRPDILIMDAVLQSHDREQRLAMRRRLREALPDATLIFLEESFTHRDSFDLFIEIEDGRIISEIGDARETDDPAAAALMQKVRKLEKTEVFAGLERRQLRLLAFSARWVEAEAGEALFHTGDPPDGAYLVVKGKAELRWPGWEPGDVAVSEVDPGRMVGDLSVLLDEPRRVDLVAVEPVKALVIDADALTSIIQADVAVATSMLRTVSGYLVEVGTRLREERLGNRIDAPIPSNIAVPAQ
ncbi:MAG: cyclic nucleotide-binding domain-containing protein, partial [Pseudomonadota bacterium]